MFLTYVIKSINRNYIYVGITNNLERRLNKHNKGLNKTTNPYKPFNLILIEKFKSRDKSRKREGYLKSGCGKEFIKKNMCMPRWRNW